MIFLAQLKIEKRTTSFVANMALIIMLKIFFLLIVFCYLTLSPTLTLSKNALLSCFPTLNFFHAIDTGETIVNSLAPYTLPAGNAACFSRGFAIGAAECRFVIGFIVSGAVVRGGDWGEVTVGMVEFATEFAIEKFYRAIGSR